MFLKSLILSSLLLLSGCIQTSKISFNVKELDSDGLQGKEGGKRSLTYEYCIMDSPTLRTKIRSIDPSAYFMKGSRGRSGCKADEVLVLGDTHQKNFAEILNTLSALTEVKTIHETHFE
jgi:hypothetical protein